MTEGEEKPVGQVRQARGLRCAPTKCQDGCDQAQVSCWLARAHAACLPNRLVQDLKEPILDRRCPSETRRSTGRYLRPTCVPGAGWRHRGAEGRRAELRRDRHRAGGSRLAQVVNARSIYAPAASCVTTGSVFEEIAAGREAAAA